MKSNNPVQENFFYSKGGDTPFHLSKEQVRKTLELFLLFFQFLVVLLLIHENSLTCTYDNTECQKLLIRYYFFVLVL